MCNRPRCAAHLEARGHCHRCNEAVGYELEGRADTPWYVGGSVGVAGSLAALIAHAPTIGLPIAGAATALSFVATKLGLRRAAEKRLAPRLAATTGEVAPKQDLTAEPHHETHWNVIGWK